MRGMGARVGMRMLIDDRGGNVCVDVWSRLLEEGGQKLVRAEGRQRACHGLAGVGHPWRRAVLVVRSLGHDLPLDPLNDNLQLRP